MLSLASLAVLALAPAGALGRIVNMTFPARAPAGSIPTVGVQSEIYIQNWDDFGIIFGLARPQNACGTCLGERIAWVNLNNGTAPIIPPGQPDSPVKVQIPKTTEPGEYLLVAAVPYLVGASGTTGIQYFNGSIEITAPVEASGGA